MQHWRASGCAPTWPGCNGDAWPWSALPCTAPKCSSACVALRPSHRPPCPPARASWAGSPTLVPPRFCICTEPCSATSCCCCLEALNYLDVFAMKADTALLDHLHNPAKPQSPCWILVWPMLHQSIWGTYLHAAGHLICKLVCMGQKPKGLGLTSAS